MAVIRGLGLSLPHDGGKVQNQALLVISLHEIFVCFDFWAFRSCGNILRFLAVTWSVLRLVECVLLFLGVLCFACKCLFFLRMFCTKIAQSSETTVQTNLQADLECLGFSGFRV